MKFSEKRVFVENHFLIHASMNQQTCAVGILSRNSSMEFNQDGINRWIKQSFNRIWSFCVRLKGLNEIVVTGLLNEIEFIFMEVLQFTCLVCRMFNHVQSRHVAGAIFEHEKSRAKKILESCGYTPFVGVPKLSESNPKEIQKNAFWLINRGIRVLTQEQLNALRYFISKK